MRLYEVGGWLYAGGALFYADRVRLYAGFLIVSKRVTIHATTICQSQAWDLLKQILTGFVIFEVKSL